MAFDRAWQESGARSAVRAQRPVMFIEQHIRPLLIGNTIAPRGARETDTYNSEDSFWNTASTDALLYSVNLERFRITNWFPRAPGVYWSHEAEVARNNIYIHQQEHDPRLGAYYKPQDKMGLIENGGIGSVRLRPRRVDGEYCWLGTAVSGNVCHAGVPVAIPEALLDKTSIEWGECVNVRGRVRYLQDAGLDDIASSVHHARPLIIFVESLEGVASHDFYENLTISPTVLLQVTPQSKEERAKRWLRGWKSNAVYIPLLNASLATKKGLSARSELDGRIFFNPFG